SSDLVTQEPQTFAGNLLDQRQKSFMDDSDAGAGVDKHMLVFVNLGRGADGHGDGADFYGTEETVEKFGDVRQEQQYAFFDAHAKLAKRIAGAIGAVQKLLISDLLVSAFDGDSLGASL